MALEVIGAGFGRTGTMSLKQALEELGFGPCHHMMELFRDDAGAELTAKWEKVSRGEDKPDWDAVFDGYRATVDWPGCFYYRELAERYPKAKVILTVRDAEDWIDSAEATIFSPDNWSTRSETWLAMITRVVGEGTFQGRSNERDYAIEVFNRHIDEVRRAIPPKRLLVFDICDGWAPLCEFLGVPVPDRPFPHANSAAKFWKERKDGHWR